MLTLSYNTVSSVFEIFICEGLTMRLIALVHRSGGTHQCRNAKQGNSGKRYFTKKKTDSFYQLPGQKTRLLIGRCFCHGIESVSVETRHATFVMEMI